ncbi:MAG: hypothetical protein RMX35_29290 [Nostoc sp. DcaGUA01]|nr:hypothetical protein [Nostoc sp. DcaGUA01]
MNINKDTSLINNSISASTEKYLPSANRNSIDAYNYLSFQLTGMMVAATIMTSASTLPFQPISIGSAISTDIGVYSLRRTRRSSQAAITAFTTELQKRSQSLSPEDAQLLRKVILSKSQPGIPRF